MPRVPGCDAVYDVADEWRERCLKQDGSLLWPDLAEQTWNIENCEIAHGIVAEFGKRSSARISDFIERFSLEPSSIRRIFADSLALYYLFPGDLQIKSKKDWVGSATSIVDDGPANLELLQAAYDSNVGKSEGSVKQSAFQMQRDAHLSLIVKCAIAVKRGGVDPYDLSTMATLVEITEKSIPRSASCRNMLLHGLFPDYFEAIFDNRFKSGLLQNETILKLGSSSPPDDLLRQARANIESNIGRKDFSFYDSDVADFLRAGQEPLVGSKEPNFWWVNQGKNFEDEFLGGFIYAPGQSQSGVSLQHHQRLAEMRVGDWVFHYAGGALLAIGQVVAETSHFHKPGLQVGVNYFRLPRPIQLSDFPPKLINKGEGPFDRYGGIKQQYAFPLTVEFVTSFARHFVHDLPPSAFGPSIILRPTLQEASTVTHLSVARLSEIESLIKTKKQIILEGPPGVGKTFVARLFARYLAGVGLDDGASDRVEIVQFHQSYGYEDFVAGIRPFTSENGQLTYRSEPGIFLQMCRRAEERPDETFVLIIDEINRGNLSRIFGELLYALEYREQAVRLQTPVEIDGERIEHLRIPDNLYLIGTMNSTDRSLAMIDYALRRRFYFWRLMPTDAGEAPVLRRWLETQSDLAPAQRAQVHNAFTRLNAEIGRQLGEDYQIGHSYFMLPDGALADPVALERVWRHAIEPLLREYFHTRSNAGTAIEQLRIGFFGAPAAVAELTEPLELDQ